MKKPLLVQIKTGLEYLSSYDKQMEDFVSKKPNRIIKVEAFENQGQTYYKCDELDYWSFTKQMIVNTNPTGKEKASLYMQYMMNGGTCVYGKYPRKVFQGENGNFYIEKDENDISKGVTLFTNLFCKLEVA